MQYSNKSKWAPTRKPGIQYISEALQIQVRYKGQKIPAILLTSHRRDKFVLVLLGSSLFKMARLLNK